MQRKTRVCSVHGERSSEREWQGRGSWTSAERLDSRLGELEAVDKRVGQAWQALADGRGEGLRRRRVRVAEDDPEARAVELVSGADGAGELGDFEARAVKKLGEDAAGVVHEVAETLADENSIHVARCGEFHFFKVVIRQGLFERNLDGRGRLALIRDDANGHNAYLSTTFWKTRARYFG